MEKGISEYAARRAFLGLLVAASATGACYALNTPRSPEDIIPTETATTHPNPTEVFAPIDKIGPYEIAASGVGYADSLDLKVGDTVYEDKVRAKALEAFETTNPNLSISRIVVQNYQIKGEKGDAPFPIVTVVDTLDPTKIISAFAGFAVDKYGVLTPPYEGDDLGILIRLTYVDTPNGMAIGAQDIKDPTSIYEPAFFNIDKDKNTTFSNPYTDDYSFNRSVPVEGSTQITSMVSYTNEEEVAPTAANTSEFNITNSPESPKISTITIEDVTSGKLAEFEHTIADKMPQISNDSSNINYYMHDLFVSGAYALELTTKDDWNRPKLGSKFLSVYKIDLTPWGFNDKDGYVFSYIKEDSEKNKTIFHFIATEKQVQIYKDADLINTTAFTLVPMDKLETPSRDAQYIDGKPNGENDMRSLQETLYTVQGSSVKEIRNLFKSIADKDIIVGTDKTQAETIIFHGQAQPTNHD